MTKQQVDKPPVPLACSFCGKTQQQVRKLIAGDKTCICDECIFLCNEILAAEGDMEPPFASRTLTMRRADGSQEPVEVGVRAPAGDEAGGFSCRAEVVGASFTEQIEARGADALAALEEGIRRAHQICEYCHRELDAEFSSADGQAYTEHLQAALRAGVVELMAGRAEVDDRDRRGASLLHLAALVGLPAWVNLLLALGADPEARDVQGRSPLELAHSRGHTEVVGLLRLHSGR